MGLTDFLKAAKEVKNKAVEQFVLDCKRGKGRALQKLCDETQKKLNKELGLVFETRAHVDLQNNSIIIQMKSKI